VVVATIAHTQVDVIDRVRVVAIDIVHRVAGVDRVRVVVNDRRVDVVAAVAEVAIDAVDIVVIVTMNVVVHDRVRIARVRMTRTRTRRMVTARDMKRRAEAQVDPHRLHDRTSRPWLKRNMKMNSKKKPHDSMLVTCKNIVLYCEYPLKREYTISI